MPYGGVYAKAGAAALADPKNPAAIRADRTVVVGDGNLTGGRLARGAGALGGPYAEMYETWINQSHAAIGGGEWFVDVASGKFVFGRRSQDLLERGADFLRDCP